MGKLRKFMTGIGPVVALGAVLRLAGLGRLCLWYDEAFTAWLARLPAKQMVAATAGDVHPPLWYAVEGLAVRIVGGSEWALRLPSAILGVVNVWLAWRVARAWGLGRRAAWLAGLLVAVSPVAVYYSQEARSYQLLLSAVLVMAWGVATWGRWGWAAFVGGGAMAVWAHNLGAFYVAALAVAALARDWRRWRAVGLAGLVIVAIWAPWLAVVVEQAAKVRAGFWVQPLTLGGYLQGWVWLVWGFGSYDWASLAGILAAMVLVAVALVEGVKGRRWGLLAWLAGPGLLLALASVAWRPVLLDRALIGAVPALAMLLGLALDRGRAARWVALAAAPLLVIWLATAQTAMLKQPIRDYAAEIRAGWQEGDLVFHGNLASYILFDYYLPGLDNAVWRQANDLTQSLTDETKEAMGVNQITVADLTEYGRLWVVWSETPFTAPAELQVIGGMLAAWPCEVVRVIEESETVTAKVYLVSLERGEGGFRPPAGESRFRPSRDENVFHLVTR